MIVPCRNSGTNYLDFFVMEYSYFVTLEANKLNYLLFHHIVNKYETF